MRISDWSSDVCSSDLELLGHDRPDWELSAARLARVIREVPEAFAPKHRWAMDWYYPVLGGVVLGDAGRARLEERRDTFVMEDRGVRCVSDRPWITVAENCECALEIGRASGRDRVGQSVWISVAAVYLKKKKN